MGKIHGSVINPAGAPEISGNVSLSIDGGRNSKYTFPVSAQGTYSGEAAAGTYMLVFRELDTPPEKTIDTIDGVKIVAGQDTLQDDDMSRQEYIDKRLTPEQKKQLEEIKKQNSKEVEIVKNLNADLKASDQDFADADAASAAAKAALGASASAEDLAAKETEIKTAKYTDAITIMQRDTAARPDASSLWVTLGLAQLGLAKASNDPAKWSDAEASLQKALDVEKAAKKPSLGNEGTAESDIAEIYARTGKIDEAKAAYDTAAKMNPPMAGAYLSNEAVIFLNANNADAAGAAADEAIQADPKRPLPYYLKGQALIQKATLDPSGKMVLPPGCAEAYQKYLQLAPAGSHADEVKAILAEAAEVHTSAFGDTSKKKKK